MTLAIGSLFSGIGGLEMGLEMAGLGPVKWQVEIDPFCNRVLAKHWPNVTRFTDVSSVREYPHVDIICGGFPCTDVSSAGKQAGLRSARSGLWWDYARIVKEVRPRFVVVENVASGARLWLPTVRRQLYMLGYDSTAYRISAADVGAPHLRRRIFVIAHSNRGAIRQQPGGGARSRRAHSVLAFGAGKARDAGDADCDSESTQPVDGEMAGMRGDAGSASGWPAPPDVCRMDDGLSRELDAARLKALGNAVVPQCAEVVGRIVRRMAGA